MYRVWIRSFAEFCLLRGWVGWAGGLGLGGFAFCFAFGLGWLCWLGWAGLNWSWAGLGLGRWLAGLDGPGGLGWAGLG